MIKTRVRVEGRAAGDTRDWFVQGGVGGYMAPWYELVELER